MDSPEAAKVEWLDRVTSGSIDAEHSPYRVVDYLGWQRDGSLELRPHYQRGSVWTKRDKSFLIDSLVKGYPLPLIVLQDELSGSQPRVRRRVVDGQQRLRTLFAFIEPALLPDLNDSDSFLYAPPELEKRGVSFVFESLPTILQTRILNARIPAVLLDSQTADREVLEVYDRLNSTGLGLNAQELRYARREGQFAETSYQLARMNQSRWTEWKLFRDQDVARMKEVEFTSELVLLTLRGIDKTGRREIDDAYRDEVLRAGLPGQTEVERYFIAFMDLIDNYLARPQHPDRVRMFRTKGWFYALYALSLARLGFLDNDLHRNDQPINTTHFDILRGDLESLTKSAAGALEAAKTSDPELIRSISGSASDRAARVRRVRFLESLL